jgi:hypothetical protein
VGVQQWEVAAVRVGCKECEVRVQLLLGCSEGAVRMQ